jgi:hypothetical protein
MRHGLHPLPVLIGGKALQTLANHPAEAAVRALCQRSASLSSEGGMDTEMVFVVLVRVVLVMG